MMNRRTAFTAGAGLGLLALNGPALAVGAPLGWTFYQADANGFRRTPVLLTGRQDAILLDGGFTLSDGETVAAAIRKTGKRLTTIYVSQSDPDYYFSLGPIVAAFPQAQVIAAPETVTAINATVVGKLATWGPKLGANGPRSLADVVIPKPSAAPALKLEGHQIQVIKADGLPNHRYLWSPDLQAVFGGVLISAGIHVWMADTATRDQRDAWIRTLDLIAARRPRIVVPAHRTEGSALDISAVLYTRDYIKAFESELSKAKGSADLVAAMKRLYPRALDVESLELGAKVATGEMRWG
jgi:glyoxylase-like metal-dependent hydrolase (beta-lactamase superfamily II)